ncbi:cysteine-rich CWC family protein [Alicyclobacillus sacchari]|uniref:cysteine-rich CWC family protein n=1 Tax=Alicyclobacillus sacchari TaxID=392010 RepID=UPI003D67407D
MNMVYRIVAQFSRLVSCISTPGVKGECVLFILCMVRCSIEWAVSLVAKRELIHVQNETLCPLCGMDNRCGHAAGNPPGTCWCDNVLFPEEVLKHIPSSEVCICEICLERLKRRLGR